MPWTDAVPQALSQLFLRMKRPPPISSSAGSSWYPQMHIAWPPTTASPGNGKTRSPDAATAAFIYHELNTGIENATQRPLSSSSLMSTTEVGGSWLNLATRYPRACACAPAGGGPCDSLPGRTAPTYCHVASGQHPSLTSSGIPTPTKVPGLFGWPSFCLQSQ